MTKIELYSLIKQFVANSELNKLSPKLAIYPELAGMRLFDEPLIGFSSALDPLYTETYQF